MNVAYKAIAAIAAYISPSSALANVSSVSTKFTSEVSSLELQISDLNSSLHRIENWLLAFTVLVVVGLVLEVRGDVKLFWRLRYAERTGLERPHKETSREVLVTIAGALLIVFGVLGELWEEHLANGVDTSLGIDNNKVSDLLKLEAETAEENISNAMDRTYARHLRKCKTWTGFSGIRAPKKIELVWVVGTPDADELAVEFEGCFRKVGWPMPTEQKLQPGTDLTKFGAHENGLTIAVDKTWTNEDIKAWRPDPNAQENQFPYGTPARALKDAVQGTIQDVMTSEGLLTPHDTIRVIIAPKP